MKVRVKKGLEGLTFCGGEVLEVGYTEGLCYKFSGLEDLFDKDRFEVVAGYSLTDICSRCGRAFRRHSADYGQCPTKKPWLLKVLDDAPPPEDVFAPATTVPTPVLEDPSARRDREHKAKPVLDRTPYDHFPDLKGWTMVSGNAGEDEYDYRLFASKRL